MKNICNQNISFYYYGQDHLILNIYKYIKSQIEENNYVFLYCDIDLFNIITENLNSNEKEMVGTINLDNIILKTHSFEYKNETFFEPLIDANKYICENGFWGGVLIIDATHLINSIGEKNFIEYIKILSKVCESNNLNIMTCYDFLDYMNRGKKINEEVIRASYYNHDFRLFSNKVQRAENFNVYI